MVSSQPILLIVLEFLTVSWQQILTKLRSRVGGPFPFHVSLISAVLLQLALSDERDIGTQ